MSVIHGFFFDLDGTLVNTHQANFYAYKQAVKEITGVDLNTPLRDSIMRGEHSDEFLPKLLPVASAGQIADINAKKKEVYPQHLHLSEPNEFLVNFLQQMVRDFQTVLVTTAKRTNALNVLKAHSLEPLFTHMIFGDDVKNMKPDPEAYLLALQLTKLKPTEAIIFEDSDIGLKTAEAAGIAAIHIKTFK
jgi:HAD superfamily hydrolase (TIGR01509 family)